MRPLRQRMLRIAFAAVAIVASAAIFTNSHRESSVGPVSIPPWPVSSDDATSSTAKAGNWPRTVNEAVGRIISKMSEKDMDLLRATPKRDLIQFHSGWGMGIRNEFGLWQGNNKLLRSCGSEKMHPDDASTVIIKAVWMKLQNTNNPDDVQKLFRAELDRLVEAAGSDEYEDVCHEVYNNVQGVPNEEWAVEALNRAVGKNKRRQHEATIIILALSDQPVFQRELVALVSDLAPRARSIAVQSLGERPVPNVAQVLNHVMLEDPDLHVRINAINSARRLNLKDCFDTVIKLARAEIEHPTYMEYFLILTISDYQDPRGAFYLEHIFEKCKNMRDTQFGTIPEKGDAKEQMKHCVEAAHGLYRITHDEKYMTYLVTMLDDRDIHHDTGFIPGVAHWAARAVCKFHGQYDPKLDDDELIARAKKLTAGKQNKKPGL